ncbi:MAG: DUF2281 domain-containing protein [Candidatus Aminicenantes bacterium]|nr:DUF2281 domain-containing protein [Candidatus Aminicenantes bacterium]
MATLNETLRTLPENAKQEVIDFAEFIAQKYRKKQIKTAASTKRVLRFAGVWKDMKEKDYQGLIDDVYARREKAFSQRRNTFLKNQRNRNF